MGPTSPVFFVLQELYQGRKTQLGFMRVGDVERALASHKRIALRHVSLFVFRHVRSTSRNRAIVFRALHGELGLGYAPGGLTTP